MLAILHDDLQPYRIGSDGKGLTSGRLTVLDGLISVRVWKRGPSERWMTMWFNPSRVVDPQGWELAGLPAAQAALSHAWTLLRPLVTPRGSLESAALSRLDVATDFRDVLLPARYIRNLADAPHSGHGQRQGIWSGAHRSHGETLYWRNKGGKVRLYDKNVETRGRAPKGVLRFEVEARGKWCKRAGLSKVGDLCEERLTALMRHRWASTHPPSGGCRSGARGRRPCHR